MKGYHPDNETADPLLYTVLRGYSHEMRYEPTMAEIRLWECLRAKRLGVKFRRQHVIDDYIADFVCLSEKLVIEVDGEYHNEEEQQTLDKQRTERLDALGYRVLRFTNDQVLFQIEDVLETIQKHFIS